MRFLGRFIVVTLALFSFSLFADTLEKLESILARYKTMQAFLDDPKAVLEYREALKSYMGEGADFDPVYDRLIEQVRDAAKNIPNFAKQAWVPNPDWKKNAYVIRGEYVGSPLSMKRDAVFKAIDKWKAAVAAGAKALTGMEAEARKAEVGKLVEELRTEYGFLSSEDFGKLPNVAKRTYQQKIGTLSKDPRFQLLSDYAAHELLTMYERTGDALASGDPDILAKELGLMQKAQNYKVALASLGVDIPEEFLTYMKLASREATDLLKAYEKGVASAKGFQAIGDPRLPPEVLARMAELEGQGVPQAQIYSKLSAPHAAAYDKWRAESDAATAKKMDFERAHTRENPYFFYTTQEDPARGVWRLKASGGLEVHVIPSPRPFISFAAGRKKGECVGGRSCEDLTPRRWARGALLGAETHFTETGDGKMEGYIGLTPLQHEKTKQVFGIVDIMSHALKGDVVLKSPAGKPVKYSFFDIFVDRHPVPRGWKGLSISDGSAVSMNVNAGEVVLNAPSYVEDKVVGKPEQFAPTDPMAVAIANQYPKGMYQGGMIYDGMRKDGTKVVRLVPTKERRRWTEREFLLMMLEKRPEGYETFDDQSVVWKIALENNIPVKSPSYYRSDDFLLDLLRTADAALMTRLLEKELLPKILAAPENERAAAFRKLRDAVHLPLSADLTEAEFRRRLYFLLHFPARYGDNEWTEELEKTLQQHPEWLAVVRDEFGKHPFRLGNHKIPGDRSLYAWDFYSALWSYLLDAHPNDGPDRRRVHALALKRADTWSGPLHYHSERRQKEAKWPEEDLPLFLAFLRDRQRIGLHLDELPLLEKAWQEFPGGRAALATEASQLAVRGNDPVETQQPVQGYRLEGNGKYWTPNVLATVEAFLDSKDPSLQALAVRALRDYYGVIPKKLFDKIIAASPNLPAPAKNKAGIFESDLRSLLGNQLAVFKGLSGDRWTTLSSEAWEMLRKQLAPKQLADLVKEQTTWTPGVWDAVVHIGGTPKGADVAFGLAAKRPPNTAVPDSMWALVNKTLPLELLKQFKTLPASTWAAMQTEIETLMSQINDGFKTDKTETFRAARLLQLVNAAIDKDEIPEAMRDVLRSRELAAIAKKLGPDFIGVAAYQENITPRSWLADCRRRAARFLVEKIAGKSPAPTMKP